MKKVEGNSKLEMCWKNFQKTLVQFRQMDEEEEKKKLDVEKETEKKMVEISTSISVDIFRLKYGPLSTEYDD